MKWQRKGNEESNGKESGGKEKRKKKREQKERRKRERDRMKLGKEPPEKEDGAKTVVDVPRMTIGKGSGDKRQG